MEKQQARPAPKKKGKRRKKKKKSVMRRILGIAMLLGIIILIGGSAIAAVLAGSIYAKTDVSSLDTTTGTTVIYDVNGDPYLELTTSRVDYVSIDQIPEIMKQAIVAVEDSRFYEHVGFDPIGIARAAVTNLTKGGISQGGSTITQQLAKNRYLSAEQTFTRKFNEAVIAVKLERHYTKDQILEQYLNMIYYGEGAWGIQNAARIYFGKDVGELDIAEAALLAGLPKAPSYYSPVKNPDKALQRRNVVLQVLGERDVITAGQMQEALATPITMAERTVNTAGSRDTSSYVDYVIEQAIEITGLTEQEVLTGGLHIYTALDPKMQHAAEQVYADPSNFPEDAGGLQSGIVLLDSQSGWIRALVGQIGEKQHYRGFNYATQTQRQPGSTIKPLVVYAPALLEGFKARDMILDTATDFGGYTPMNYGRKFYGWVTMEQALIQSYNIPAVAMLKEIGIDRGMELVKEAGLPLQKSDRTLALALGGMESGVSPLEMAQAYTMFAAEGTWSKAQAIVEIFDKQKKLFYRAPLVQKGLLTPSIAYEMTTMMEKVVTQGTGKQAAMNRRVAGKTGTTQLPDIAAFSGVDGVRDAWFVGYTPQVVGAVWIGYPNTDKDHYLTTTGGRYPAEVFKRVVEQALAGEPELWYDRPDNYDPNRGEIRYVNGTPPSQQVEEEEEPEEPIDEGIDHEQQDEGHESDADMEGSDEESPSNGEATNEEDGDEQNGQSSEDDSSGGDSPGNGQSPPGSNGASDEATDGNNGGQWPLPQTPDEQDPPESPGNNADAEQPPASSDEGTVQPPNEPEPLDPPQNHEEEGGNGTSSGDNDGDQQQEEPTRIQGTVRDDAEQ